MEEIWKPIENYENYSVSTFGQVRNDTTGRILKEWKTGKYWRINLCKNGIIQKYLIHRLVAIAFIKNLEDKPDVDHIDNNPSNNKVENLRWATSQENNQNRLMSSRNKSGVKGVDWEESRLKWRAFICIDGIYINLGRYNTIEEATLARQTRANLAFGVFTNACETILI